MRNENSKFEILLRINEEIKESAHEIFNQLSEEDKTQDASELAETYEEEITEALFNLFENFVTYYSDAAQIVAEFRYYNSWNELEILGGEAPTNISQLAYAVIYEETMNEGLLYNYGWAFEEIQEEETKTNK